MVVITRQENTYMRRRSSATVGKVSSMSCAMGDEDDVSLSSISSHQSTSFSGFPSSDTYENKRRSSLLPSAFGRNAATSNHVKTPRWVLGVLCIFTTFSWIRAIQFRSTSLEVLSAMEDELKAFEMQTKQSRKLLQDATDTQNDFAKHQWKLKRTQRNFQHETRMLEEMYEMEASQANDNVPIPEEALKRFKDRQSGNVAKKWIEHRQEAILHKVYNLQAYIQEESRKRVIEKYGPGPHLVVFDVKSREGRKPGKFTIRMAPLSTVPHAIETFLDMVAANVLDNMLFYSHHSSNHIIPAAPISYGTFQSKDREMNALGFTGVSFPEYSKEFPHKKNTIGFTGMEHNFYINTIDNDDHHGPGGQEHHELEGDADPCFGEIISGTPVLIDMQYNRHKGAVAKGWEDYDLTRIVSARIIPWP